MKCSGKNCPMQHTYDIGECKIVETCDYVTTVGTKADRIRAMNDHDLAVFLEQSFGKYIDLDWMELLDRLQEIVEEDT